MVVRLGGGRWIGPQPCDDVAQGLEGISQLALGTVEQRGVPEVDEDLDLAVELLGQIRRCMGGRGSVLCSGHETS